MSLKLAVIGNPVAHSRSPEIHAAFAAQAGVELSYERVEAPRDGFAETVDRLRGEGYAGANVTVPFKGEAHALCETLSDAAEQAQAVNTLTFGGGIAGENTDGTGFMADIARLGIDLAGKSVVIIGAGGAAAGILGPIMAAAPKQVVVTGRNPYNAEALAERFGAFSAHQSPAVKLMPCTYLALKGIHADVLINASPAGHHGAMPGLPRDLLVDGAPTYDLSYGDAHSVFRDWATAHGAGVVHDGLGMLVAQAAESFRIWTGKTPEFAPVIEQLRA